MEKFVNLDGIDVIYSGKNKKTYAVKDVSLTLDEGDFAALLGPSGCGKTTIVNVLAGFIKATKGTAKLKGKNIETSGKDRGVIFQDANLFPWLTIEDNIKFGPRINGVDKEQIDKLYDEYINIIGLKSYENHYPFELSGGMRQRVAIARTMINSPELILMDEPFGALDAITKKIMTDFLRNIWDRHRFTAVMISHDIEEALSLSNKVFVMGDTPGTIVKKFEVDFSSRILSGEERVESSSDFLQVKYEILDYISKNHNIDNIFK